MILENGDKVLLAHQRLFEDDEPRFFVGIVEDYEAGIVRVKGQAWVRDLRDGRFCAHQDLRVRVESLASGTLIVYVLPHECDLESLRLESGQDRSVIVTDGVSLQMELPDRIAR